MKTRKLGLVAGLLGTVVLATLSWTAHAADEMRVMLITGENWVSSSENGKIGFLYGIENFAEIEQAMHGDKVPGDTDSLVPVLVRGLDGKSVDDVKRELDQWYADNPDQLDRPVLETIWFELALPNS